MVVVVMVCGFGGSGEGELRTDGWPLSLLLGVCVQLLGTGLAPRGLSRVTLSSEALHCGCVGQHMLIESKACMRSNMLG